MVGLKPTLQKRQKLNVVRVLIAILFMTAGQVFAADNAMRARIGQMVVRVMGDEVRLDNSFIVTGEPNSQVCFRFPAGAYNLGTEDTNGVMLNAEEKTICKRMDGKAYANLSYFYSLKNAANKCAFDLRMPVPVNAFFIYASIRRVLIESPVFKIEADIAKQAGYPASYAAKNLPADVNIPILITIASAEQSGRMIETAAAAGLAAIIAAAVATIAYYRRSRRAGSQG
jgi:hypothetical protein